MATYQELTRLGNGADAAADALRQQVKAAIAKSAFAITNEAGTVTNHAQRLAWAKAALGALDSEVQRVIWYVLAANAGATFAQITTASDATVQTAVDAAVNLFAS